MRNLRRLERKNCNFNAKFRVMSKKLDMKSRFDIRALRRELKLSQEECARSMGWSVRKFQMVEKSATIEQLVLFVVAFGDFKMPEHPLDFFEVHGKMFDLKKYMI